jgi:DNA-binding NarL/FixJ family response regulator
MLERYGAVSVVATVRAGLAVVHAERVTGLILDFALPDGSGIEIARAARAIRAITWDTPVLMISGAVDARRLVEAHQVRAGYLLKPVDRREVVEFAKDAVQRERRAAVLLQQWVKQYALTAAEEVTLRLAIDGLRRDEIAAERRVSPITVRNQETALTRKFGAESITDVVAAFYRALYR